MLYLQSNVTDCIWSVCVRMRLCIQLFIKYNMFVFYSIAWNMSMCLRVYAVELPSGSTYTMVCINGYQLMATRNQTNWMTLKYWKNKRNYEYCVVKQYRCFRLMHVIPFRSIWEKTFLILWNTKPFLLVWLYSCNNKGDYGFLAKSICSPNYDDVFRAICIFLAARGIQ